MILAFIDEHQHAWGIEPLCRTLSQEFDLKIAPGTYCAFKDRRPSVRTLRDAQLKEKIMTIHTHKHTRVHGIRKIHAHLNRTGTRVARCTVERFCGDLGVRGTVRGQVPTHHQARTRGRQAPRSGLA